MRKRLLLLFFLVACGTRTGLLIDSYGNNPDASGTPDATSDTPEPDGPILMDAGPPDVLADAVPPIDVVLPDVITPLSCTDASTQYIYLLSAADNLLSFDPSTLTLKTIGKVSCPTAGFTNSMAVDHLGVAYADFVDPDGGGEIFKLSTSTAACSSTTYAVQDNFTKFGMGFVADLDGGENLFIADTVHNPSGALAEVDVSTYKLNYVGPFAPPLPVCELTGTGDGRLFAFCMNKPTGSTLAQVDPKTAKQIGADTLKTGGIMNAFAFGFWGGNFYLFTGTGGSTITEYDPIKKTETIVKTTSDLIVGAGVSTCAPL